MPNTQKEHNPGPLHETDIHLTDPSHYTDNTLTDKNPVNSYSTAILNASPDGVLILGKGSTILYVNKKATAMVGYTDSELIGQPLNILIPSRFHKKHEKNIAGYVKNPGLISMQSSKKDLYGKRKNGQEFPIDVSLSTIDTEEGQLVICFMRDLTGKRQISSKLRESKRLYRDLLDNTTELIAKVSLNGQIIWVNDAWKKTYQYKEKELKTFNIINTYQEESKEAFLSILPKILEGEVVKNMRLKTNSKNGNQVDVEGYINPVMEDGKLIALQGFFKNVTEINAEKTKRQQAENRLKFTLDNLVVGCTIIDHNWNYLYINDFQATQGYTTPKERIGKNLLEVHSHAVGSHVHEMYRQCLEDRKFINFEDKFKFKNGVEKWYDFRLQPVDEGMCIMTLDITERKTAELKLLKQQELLKMAESIAHFGSWESIDNDQTIFWTDELYRILELPPETTQPSYALFIGRVHPEDRERINRAKMDSLLNSYGYKIEYRLLFDDGRVKHIQDQIAHFFDHEGKHIRTGGTMHDITAYKISQLQLIENEIKYHRLVENIPDAIVQRDMTGSVKYYNQQFLDMFGITRSEINQLSDTEQDAGTLIMPQCIVPEDKKKVSDIIRSKLAGDRTDSIVEFNVDVNGEIKWLEGKISAMTENDTVVGMQAMIRDITARKKAELQLEWQNSELVKINSELDNFVYRTSHDLRSPLMTLFSLIRLSKETNDTEELEKYLEMMDSSVKRLDQTILNIIDYSRNARTKNVIEAISIDKILTDIHENTFNQGLNHDITFTSSIATGLPFYSDYFRVSFIINSLINNAYRYQRSDEQHKAVSVYFYCTETTAVITVTDNGEGIAPEKQDRIFEMFYRNSSKSVGSGLGLYICREVIHKLGGRIAVQSAPGNGSTFLVTLPNNPPK